MHGATTNTSQLFNINIYEGGKNVQRIIKTNTLNLSQ